MTWDKNLPAGNQARALGDDAIRANNDHLETALASEHQFPANANPGQQGRHKFGVGDAAARDAAIPAPEAGNQWFNSGTQSVEFYNGSAWISSSSRLVGELVQTFFDPSSPPTGYLECNGAAVSRSTYAALFAVVGTTFGVGDGSTTFNLPNMGGRSAIGFVNGGDGDSDYGVIGELHGIKKHQLVQAELPDHTHTVNDPGHVHALNGYGQVGLGNLLIQVGVGQTQPLSQVVTATTGITVDGGGSDTAHETRHPVVTLGQLIFAGV